MTGVQIVRRMALLTVSAASFFTGRAAFAVSTPDISLSFTDTGAVNSGSLSVNLTPKGTPVFSSTGGPGNNGEITIAGVGQATSTNYLDITPTSGNLTNLGGTSNYTIAMWINTSTPGGAFLYKGAATWGSNDEIFNLTSGTGNGTGGAGLHVGGVQWSGGFVGGSTNITSGAWTHIAIVRSGGTDTFYVNGVADSTTATNMSHVENGTQDIRLGFQNDTVTGDGVTNFNGSISGVNIYSSALSASDIQTLMVNTPEPSAVALMSLGALGLLRRRRNA